MIATSLTKLCGDRGRFRRFRGCSESNAPSTIGSLRSSPIWQTRRSFTKIDGRCHCGNISFEAEIDPDTVTICHCTDCQTLSGSAFRVVVPATREGFKLLIGEPKLYVKTGESGRQRVQSFCRDCGTPIYSAAVADPQAFSIRVGTVRQRAELRPKAQIWCRSALNWVKNTEPTKQFEKQDF